MFSYYFSYFAFNVNKRAKKYLLLWIYFDVNYIYLQIHHHHVDMLCYYKTLTANMSSNIFNCSVYWAAADTFVNDFTLTHCASCLFNTVWFIYMLLLIGLTFLTHPPNKRKDGCFSNGRLHPTKAAFLGCHVIKRRWRPSQSEGSLEDSLRFVSFIQLNLKDAWDVSFTTFNHPQSFVPIPFHENKLTKNESVLNLSEFIMKSKTKIMFWTWKDRYYLLFWCKLLTKAKLTII